MTIDGFFFRKIKHTSLVSKNIVRIANTTTSVPFGCPGDVIVRDVRYFFFRGPIGFRESSEKWEGGRNPLRVQVVRRG